MDNSNYKCPLCQKNVPGVRGVSSDDSFTILASTSDLKNKRNANFIRNHALTAGHAVVPWVFENNYDFLKRRLKIPGVTREHAVIDLCLIENHHEWLYNDFVTDTLINNQVDKDRLTFYIGKRMGAAIATFRTNVKTTVLRSTIQATWRDFDYGIEKAKKILSEHESRLQRGLERYWNFIRYMPPTVVFNWIQTVFVSNHYASTYIYFHEEPYYRTPTFYSVCQKGQDLRAKSELCLEASETSQQTIVPKNSVGTGKAGRTRVRPVQRCQQSSTNNESQKSPSTVAADFDHQDTNSMKSRLQDKLPLKRRATSDNTRRKKQATVLMSSNTGQPTTSQLKSPPSAIETMLKDLHDKGIAIPTRFKNEERIAVLYRIVSSNRGDWTWCPTIVVQTKYKVYCLWEEPVQEWLFKLRRHEATNIKRGFVIDIEDFHRKHSRMPRLSADSFMKSILAIQKNENNGWTAVDKKASGASSVHYYKIHEFLLEQEHKETISKVRKIVATAMTEHGCAIDDSTVATRMSIVMTKGKQRVQHAHIDYKNDKQRFEFIEDYCKRESLPDADNYHTNVNLRMPWVMFSPLTSHGMYLAVWPDNYNQVKEIGKVVFIPPGMILVMRGDTLHAGGFDNSMGVAECTRDPTKRLHGYIFKRSARKTRQSDKNECYLYPLPGEHDENEYEIMGRPPLRDQLETFTHTDD